MKQAYAPLGVFMLSERNQGRTVDALALEGDEGRGKLRKAAVRCRRPVTRGCPNGATRPVEDRPLPLSGKANPGN